MDNCNFNECPYPVKTRGYCNGHYQQSWKGQELRTLQHRGIVPCKFDKCFMKAVSRGYCNGHSKQIARGQEPRPLNPNKSKPQVYVYGYTEKPRCGRGDCLRPSLGSRRVCPKHYSQMSKFKLSIEDYLALPVECETCGSTQRLAIDHDHECCPGSGSCGSCVRGVLCTACNTALGFLKESKTTMSNLIDYLEKKQLQ